jgi:hypothetical protein
MAYDLLDPIQPGELLRVLKAHPNFGKDFVPPEAELTVGKEEVAGRPRTWIQMAAQTPHSIKAQTPVVTLLTLLK